MQNSDTFIAAQSCPHQPYQDSAEELVTKRTNHIPLPDIHANPSDPKAAITPHPGIPRTVTNTNLDTDSKINSDAHAQACPLAVLHQATPIRNLAFIFQM